MLEFDSVHGRWTHSIRSDLSQILIDEHVLGYAQESDFTLCPWRDAGVDIVLDCSGKNKTPEALSPYFDKLGLSKVIVACPVTGQVAGEEALNIVYGINHNLYDPNIHRVVTAASCTTNCLAPVVKVVHENFGIMHGAITTLHDITNTQSVSYTHQRLPTTTYV